MMSLISIDICNVNLTFENNTIHTELQAPKEIAILLLYAVSSTLANTSMLFIGNYVQKGRIFALVEATLRISVGELYAKFENNEGSNGGAMAFYGKSSIWKIESYDVIVVTFTFHHNVAHKRGGAIFVEDRDYIRSYDHNYDELPFLGRMGRSLLEFVNNTANISGNKCVEDGLIMSLLGSFLQLIAPMVIIHI